MLSGPQRSPPLFVAQPIAGNRTEEALCALVDDRHCDTERQADGIVVANQPIV